MTVKSFKTCLLFVVMLLIKILLRQSCQVILMHTKASDLADNQICYAPAMITEATKD